MTKKSGKPVLELVNSPNKPKSSKTGGGSGSGRNAEQRFGKYAIINRSFYQIQPTKTGPVEIQLCNFTCKIIEVVTHDDGLQDQTFLRIEGQRDDGFTLPVIEIPNAKFISTQGNWVNEFYDMRAFIHPGASINSNLRAAIQLYSTLEGEVPRRVIYKFTGWTKIIGEWCYLTGSGAITADGLREDVQVDLGPGHMSRYRLPAPFDAEQVKAAAGHVSSLLAICPGKPQIGATLLAAVARAPLGECHPIDFCIFIHGVTGARKSAITAIPLAFFGEFNARRFPANFSDTELDIEIKGFQAKDGIYVIDDFKPSVSHSEASKTHAKAERVVRNTGNQAGRGWRGSDRQAKAAPYNRSKTLITGEDVPKGQSLLGRLLILELTRADVDCNTLTALQHAAETGQLAGLMSAYLQWLAPRLDELKKDFPKIVTSLRNAALSGGYASSHPRAPEIFANLVAGATIFCGFLESAGAFNSDQAGALIESVESGLKQAFSEQGAYQSEQDETERFFDLLRALFSSGNAHIADHLEQGPPKLRPHNWGWRSGGKDIDGAIIYKPMGDCIGWYCKDKHEVWFDQSSVFAAVQQLARKQGDAFLLSPGSLWRRMLEKGLIAETETRPNGTKQTTVKRVIKGPQSQEATGVGTKRRVMVVSAGLIESA